MAIQFMLIPFEKIEQQYTGGIKSYSYGKSEEN